MTILAALTIVPAATPAQTTASRLSIHVVSDTEAVAGALIRDKNASVRTDDEGNATLPVVPGIDTIRVTKIGFRPDSTIIDSRPGFDTSLVVSLVERPAMVSPVFVTSTREERRLEEEPLRVEVLAGDDVGEKSEMRPADTRTLLSEMSGVR